MEELIEAKGTQTRTEDDESSNPLARLAKTPAGSWPEKTEMEAAAAATAAPQPAATTSPLPFLGDDIFVLIAAELDARMLGRLGCAAQRFWRPSVSDPAHTAEQDALAKAEEVRGAKVICCPQFISSGAKSVLYARYSVKKCLRHSM